MRTAFFFLICAGITCSCRQQTRFGSEISQIDSLLNHLDSKTETLSEIDTTGFTAFWGGYVSKTKLIQSTYVERQDTVQKQLANLLKEYRKLKRPYKNQINKFVKIKKELVFSKSQLRNLRHDLENNLLDTSFVSRSMREERQAIAEIERAVSEMKSETKQTLELSSKLEPKIDSVIATLQLNE